MFMQRINPLKDFILFHQGCACHIINLIVQDAVMHEIKYYVEKIRCALSYSTNSGKKQEEFDLMCIFYSLPHKKIIFHVSHSWNSVFNVK